jgi:dihydrofolate reductase
MINIVVAYAHGRVIGKDGTLPWKLPNDLRYLQQLTTGHTVVMGRKTFDSIGHPLPNRRNIVLTHDTALAFPGVIMAYSIDEVLSLAKQEDVFILGGESIYKRFLPFAHRLYITEVESDVEGGDTFFPAWEPDAYKLVSQQQGTVDVRNPLPHAFYVYERLTCGYKLLSGPCGKFAYLRFRKSLPEHNASVRAALCGYHYAVLLNALRVGQAKAWFDEAG